ncbi:MAG: PEP-CTERM sorting domain-containing protein [Phycisphaerales bacterium]|nr:MAG: PEP-CTERM sorting domain-containing protein [Phycisphaerales bacterium]
MTRRIPVAIGSWSVVFAAALVSAGLIEPARAQGPGVALLVQQTPVLGGTTHPAPGVHTFSQNAEVTLSADPSPGYRFVYWLGDVSEPVAARTVAYLDKPKIIVAVFNRIEHDTLRMRGGASNRSGGASTARSGLITSAVSFGQPSGSVSGGGSGTSGRTRVQEPPPPLPPEPPIPEPATAVLLALGSLFALTRRRQAQRLPRE